jgi:methylenetetrahydrofolate--tRNA-(uracil-5-)-methyltransferase
VVQLRQDNKLGTLVEHGRLPDQAEACRAGTVPHHSRLENAEFARLGGLHRNTFLNSPVLLDRQLRLKSAPHIRFAGQITGCEGYVESAADRPAGGPDGGERTGRAGMAGPAAHHRAGRAARTSPAMPRPTAISR